MRPLYAGQPSPLAPYGNPTARLGSLVQSPQDVADEVNSGTLPHTSMRQTYSLILLMLVLMLSMHFLMKTGRYEVEQRSFLDTPDAAYDALAAAESDEADGEMVDDETVAAADE